MRRLLAPLLAILCGLAHAGCPLEDLGDLHALGPEGREGALRGLAAAEPRCEAVADYYALRGALLYHQGRYLEAAGDLEHAILLHPRHGGALIDYALTLEALGDRTAARALVQQLSREPDLPPHIVALLGAMEARLAAPPPQAEGAPPPDAASSWLRLTLLGGYSNNRNAAPSAEGLTLTLPGAEEVWLLAPESRPNPGGLGLLALDYVPAPLALGERASLVLFAQMRLRAPPDGSDGRLVYGRLEAIAAREQRRRLDLAGLSLEALDATPGGGQFGLEVFAERRWLGGRCTPGARLSLLAQDWSGATVTGAGSARLWRLPYVDGIEPRLTGRLTCGATEASAYAGRLLAAEGRAGGDADRLGLRLGYRWTLPRGNLDLYAEGAYLKDREGYSPWLAFGARRTVRRLDLAAEWEHPLRAGWSWVTRLEHVDQRSNLELFDLRQSGVYVGLRWAGGL